MACVDANSFQVLAASHGSPVTRWGGGGEIEEAEDERDVHAGRH